MKKKTVGDYEIYLHKRLGYGASGSVFKGQNKVTKQKVAVKMIDKAKIKSPYQIHALKREVLIISKISSENVVGFKDILNTKTNYYIVQQLCEQDLRSFMKQNPKLPQKQALELVTMFLNGYYALIVINAVHRDIKPQNILFKDKKLKIADFGLSKRVSEKQLINSVVGTKHYKSPQVNYCSQYTTKCDIWSLGVMFYQMLYGNFPFQNLHKIHKIKQQCEQLQFPLSPQVSQQSKQIIRRCLRYHEQDRADWDYLFSHPFFRGDVPDLNKLNKRLSNIVSILRHQINQRNIDFLKFLKLYGIEKDKQINYAQYEKMITKLVSNGKITKQQIQYSFNYFDGDKNGRIAFNQLSKVMEAHGVQMTDIPQLQISNKFISYGNISLGQNQSDNYVKIINHEENLTIKQSQLQKIEQRTYFKVINQFQLKLYQNLQQRFFMADLTDQGLQINSFAQFLQQDLKLNITQQQCQIIFNKLDEDKSGTITSDKFEKFICKAINLPLQRLKKSNM